MKVRHAAALALVSLTLASCAQQQRASDDALQPSVYNSGGTFLGPSKDEENRYFDQPNLAVIRQYVLTDQMLSQVQVQPGGAWVTVAEPRAEGDDATSES